MAERKVLEYNGSVFENTIARNLARRYPNAIIVQNRTLYSDFLKNDTQIDLILIQRKGIFVIEAKNWKRWVKGDYNAGHWKGQAASMNVLDVFSPVNQNIIHMRALRNAIRSIAIQENTNSIDKNCPRKIMSIRNIKFSFAYYQFLGLL